MSEPWRPRPHDHLVEPLFGGLGQEAPARTPPRRRRLGAIAARLVVLAVVLTLLAGLVVVLGR